jgi:hypothetical protein
MAVPLDYGPGAKPRGLRVGWVGGLMMIVAGCLTFASVVVVKQGAVDEPYFGDIRKSDAIVQVGIGSGLIAIWILWCIAAILLVIKRRAHPLLLAIAIWALINCFYLSAGVDGYLDDIIRFQAGTYPGGVNDPTTMNASPQSQSRGNGPHTIRADLT